MALFDRLVADDDTTKIVDLGHESFESFFTLAKQIDFAEEARRRGIAPAILFVITPDRTSVEAYRNLRSGLPQATLTPVHNEMLGPAQHRDKYPVAGSGAVPVKFPALAPGLRRYIEKPPFSFSESQARQCARHTARTFISNCNAGCGRSIWSSGNSTCAFYLPTCSPRSGCDRSSKTPCHRNCI